MLRPNHNDETDIYSSENFANTPKKGTNTGRIRSTNMCTICIKNKRHNQNNTQEPFGQHMWSNPRRNAMNKPWLQDLKLHSTCPLRVQFCRIPSVQTSSRPVYAKARQHTPHGRSHPNNTCNVLLRVRSREHFHIIFACECAGYHNGPIPLPTSHRMTIE